MKNYLRWLFVIPLLMLIVEVNAQERTVNGRVTSAEDGSPLPGVNVILKGTSIGTATDADGNFRLSYTGTGSSLIFSFIGLESKEVPIGDQNVINVSLTLDVTQLSEVVVTALGLERDQKTLGFSVKQVNNQELTTGRTTNVVNALSGKVAGVRVAGSNGMVGSSSAIFIRGFTSFAANNQPLFVVDGIPINNEGGANAQQNGVSNSNRAIDLNQDDIESMTILKGPAAAVLYGSRAVAGAIIITTKKGSSNNKKVVEYTVSYNINEVNRFPDYQNEYARGTSLSSGVPVTPIYQPNADQSNWGPPIDGREVPSEYSASDRQLFGLPDVVRLTAYPNNVKDMFRRGSNIQHNLAFSGGNSKSNFFFSYNNLRDKGFLMSNLLERHSLRFNGNTQLTDKFGLGISTTYIYSQSSRSQIGNQLSNPVFRGWFLPRDYDLKNSPFERPDGSQVYFNANTDHPFWNLKYVTWNDELNRFIGNASLNYDFNDWLSLSYKVGTDATNQIIKTYDPIGIRGGGNHGSQTLGAIGDRAILTQLSSSFLNLNFKKKLGDFGITGLVGNEVSLRAFRDNGVLGVQLNSRGNYNINDASTFQPISGDESRRNLIGIYGDFQVDYRGWAFIGLTGRNDWSSTFKKGNNSYFYPSVTSSVILTESIPVLKGNNILSFAKIKANWAKVGREAPIFSTDTYYGNAGPADGFGPNILFPFFGRVGRTLQNAAGNPDLGPEFTRSYEVGTELGILKGRRINIDFTYFSTRTTDIILNVPVSATSGFTNQFQNAGVLETNGLELGISGTPISAKGFTWTVDLNWSRIRNNVISLAPGVENIAIGGFTTAQARIEAGKEFGVIYANSLARDEQGRILINPTTGLPSGSANVLVANPNPRWTGGITNSFSYKGVSLNFLLDFRYKGDILSRVINDVRRTGTAAETASLPRFDANGLPLRNYVIDGVLPDGTPNNVAITAQEYWSNLYSFAVPGEGVFDATWVRLREASIFYSLPVSLLSKTPFGKIEVGLNGRNLLLWTKVPHIDPETNLNGAGNAQGLEFNSLPQSRTYGAVLKLTF